MNDQEQDASFWVSYSDLAVGVLMVFVLITAVLLLDTVEKATETTTIKQMLEEKTKELNEKTKQIEALVGVRQSLIAELSRQFAKQGQQVKVDPKTGALELPSDIIFTQGSSTLSPQGRKWLKNFIPRYLGVLLSDDFAEHVRRIEVEGHASSEGDEYNNLELSQARAFTVTTYILKNHSRNLSVPRRTQLKEILAASGRGEYELVFNSKGEDKKASRRVVFKFRLTEEQTLKDIQKMLEVNP